MLAADATGTSALGAYIQDVVQVYSRGGRGEREEYVYRFSFFCLLQPNLFLFLKYYISSSGVIFAARRTAVQDVGGRASAAAGREQGVRGRQLPRRGQAPARARTHLRQR
jgi:hypothetical protein